MRVALVVTGSRGDIQPHAALGQELRTRGHHVRFATHRDFKELVVEAGLEFHELPGSPDDFMAHPALVKALQKGASLMRATRKVPKPSKEHLETLANGITAASEGMDLVVDTQLSRTVCVGESDVPRATTAWWPVAPTSAWPSVMAPNLRLGQAYNRFTHKLAAKTERYMVNDFRKRIGEPPLGRSSTFWEVGRSSPLVHPISPVVLSAPADWPSRCHVSGYWFWDRDWQPPADLADFLADGPKPIVLTFGSLWPVFSRTETFDMVLDVIQESGQRLVIVDGPAGRLPDGVHRTHDVNYPWLLPKASAIIHHGGANTTGEALRAGIPQVIVPAFADSPYWAGRMHALGVAAEPIPFPKFTAERLTTALATVLRDESVRATAARLGTTVRAERGVETACDLLEEWVAEHRAAAVRP